MSCFCLLHKTKYASLLLCPKFIVSVCRGKFATVRKARHMLTGVEYAAKFIRKRRRALDTQREIAHEIAVLLQCSASPRVVRLHEVYDERSEMVLVLEL